MGENVLQGQVKSFKKGADRSLKQMSLPTLFDRPDVISTVYTAKPLGKSSISEGDLLEGHITSNGQSIKLAKGHIAVAQIEGDGADTLVHVLQEPGSSGLVPMKVIKVNQVSGFIKATISRRFDNGL
ncbi:hypothetical protein [Gimesia chilikensis]|uniref:hypothetical protein n=1 Tax=Gimesia chilikensis TaxID=2605989 RepID=UPI003A91BD24